MEKTKNKKKTNLWKKLIAYILLVMMVLSVLTMAISVLAS